MILNCELIRLNFIFMTNQKLLLCNDFPSSMFILLTKILLTHVAFLCKLEKDRSVPPSWMTIPYGQKWQLSKFKGHRRWNLMYVMTMLSHPKQYIWWYSLLCSTKLLSPQKYIRIIREGKKWHCIILKCLKYDKSHSWEDVAALSLVQGLKRINLEKTQIIPLRNFYTV